MARLSGLEQYSGVVLNLGDNVSQIQLSVGTLLVRVRRSTTMRLTKSHANLRFPYERAWYRITRR